MNSDNRAVSVDIAPPEKSLSCSHATRLRRQSEHCCACSGPPFWVARLASSAGLVVVQASRQARCGCGERGHAHQEKSKADAKISPGTTNWPAACLRKLC